MLKKDVNEPLIEPVGCCPSFTPLEPSNVLRWAGVVPSFTDIAHNKKNDVRPPPFLLVLSLALIPCAIFFGMKWVVDALAAPWLWISFAVLLVVTELYNICWHFYALKKLSNTFYIDQREYKSQELFDELHSYMSKDSEISSYLNALAGREPKLSESFLRRNMSYHLFAEKNFSALPPEHQKMVNSLIFDTLGPRATAANIEICPTTEVGSDALADSFMDCDLKVIYKPFLWYIGVRILQSMFRLWLFSQGFRRRRSPESALSIFHRLKNQNSPVMVFCHGFGIGCSSYVYLIAKLLSSQKDINIVLVELPNLSYSSYQVPHPRTEDLVRTLHGQLTSLGIHRCLMVSHSYGTVIHNVFNHLFPGMISRGIFLDPVCLMVHQPKIARMRSITLNELIASQSTARWWHKFLATCSFLVVFRDLFTQFVMCRTFFMEHSYLGKLSENDTVVLAEFDDITPSSAINQFMEEHYPQVRRILRPNAGHGEVLYAPQFAVSLIAEAMESMQSEARKS